MPSLRRRRRWVLAGANNALDDVVDVCKVSLHLAVIVNIDRFAAQDRTSEQIQRHIRSAPRTIHGKEPQASRGQLIEVAIAVSHELVRLLRRRVQTQRMIHIVVN